MAEIVYIGEADDELDEFAGRSFAEHSAAHGIECGYCGFVFAAKENGKAVGVVQGYAYFDEVYISELIVSEEYRGRDIGTALIKAVEEHFAGGRFDHISLTTHRFQAAGFYEKCGFTTEFIRKSRTDPALDKYFMVKYINRH